MFAWIGKNDLIACGRKIGQNLGPVGEAVTHRNFTHVVLLSVFSEEEERRYIEWLTSVTRTKVIKYHVEFSTRNQFRDTYNAAISAIKDVKQKLGSQSIRKTFHLSSGSLAMVAAWILLSKTFHPAELIQTSRKEGVQTVSLPFDISGSHAFDESRYSDEEMLRLTQGLPPEAPEFASIIHRCKPMVRVIARARRLAVHEVPVLIQGESGTGKELFARAIHKSSTRRDKPFVAVNCGSIPPELVEAEFFGHTKGAFTGASSARDGYFIAAHEGTLFLDEIGELPLAAQVKLLRTIQEGTVTKVGSSKSQDIDVRIIAAANRNLIEEVYAGRFRDDLFHRIAVGVLHLPPLRERSGDINPLIDDVLAKINGQFEGRPGWQKKVLSVAARNILHHHPWPGNIRELFNTISRAAIWTPGKTIDAEDIRSALFPVSGEGKGKRGVLSHGLGNGFSLPDLLSEVTKHYLKRSFQEARGNKTEMAKLLGLPNYQTLSNWMKRYDVE
ncbi:MAG TPA: sigma-54 dependent transcriptional regulator [Dissulfurispiraceae bacterium]|nr:sigma-54 dependent transcriptional regulator [Dissulfurispiraceae bacterium]